MSVCPSVVCYCQKCVGEDADVYITKVVPPTIVTEPDVIITKVVTPKARRPVLLATVHTHWIDAEEELRNWDYSEEAYALDSPMWWSDSEDME